MILRRILLKYLNKTDINFIYVYMQLMLFLIIED